MLELTLDLNPPYYQTGVISSVSIPYICTPSLVTATKNIFVESEDLKSENIYSYSDDVCNFISLFDTLDGLNGAYFARRLKEIYAAEPELPFNIDTFRGLYNFALNPIFNTMYIALGIDSKGRPILQQNLPNGYIHIKFLSDSTIQYHLIHKNRDIISNGTFDEFYKDFATCPVFS